MKLQVKWEISIFIFGGVLHVSYSVPVLGLEPTAPLGWIKCREVLSDIMQHVQLFWKNHIIEIVAFKASKY